MNKKKFIVFFIILNILMFQDALQEKVPIFKNADEVIAYCSLFLIVLIVLYRRYNLLTEEVIIIYIILTIFFIGMLGTVIYKSQETYYAFIDFLLMFKFIFAYFFSKIFFRDLDICEYEKIITLEMRIATLLTFTLLLINFPLELFPINEVRYGIPSQQLFFSHPTYLVGFCINILVFLTLFIKEREGNYIYILMNLIIIFFTMRNKALIFILIYTYLVLLVALNKRFRLINTLILLLVIIIVFLPVIKEKLFDNIDYARHILYVYSFRIANDYFPLGSGFGSYASFISGKYYSNLYYKYGIEHIYGLMLGGYSFIADTFWPMVLGETGFFGFILFLVMLIQFVKIVVKKTMGYKVQYIAALIPLIYLFISSSSESSFANPMAVGFFYVIGNIINSVINKQSIIGISN